MVHHAWRCNYGPTIGTSVSIMMCLDAWIQFFVNNLWPPMVRGMASVHTSVCFLLSSSLLVTAAPEPFCFMHACFSPSLNNSHLSFANFKFVTLTVTLTAMSEQGDETLKVHHAQRKDRKKAVPTGTAQSQVATELGVVTAQTRALEEKNKTKYIHIHNWHTHTNKTK